MGHINVAYQTITFFMSIVFGMAACLVYDVFRIVHKLFCKSWLSIFVLDILYWLIMAFATFSFLLLRCTGEVRAFVLLGILCGFIICRFTLSPIFMIVALKIFKIIGSIIGLFRKPIRFLSFKIIKIFKKVLKMLKKLALETKNHLKQRMQVLYNYHINKKLNKKENRRKKSNKFSAEG